MKIRLAIYKEIMISPMLVMVALVAVHTVQCDPDAGGTTLDDGLSRHDVMQSDASDIVRMESRQMPELFSRDDVRKFLITLRTFVMGVRNFAEALGGFVPNRRISEKNAMISKYGGIFNTVRIVSNAAQYVAKYLEDLLMREIEDDLEGRQASATPSPSAVIKPFVSSLKILKSMAAQILTAYNYYHPEISYSSCMRKFVLKSYPNVMLAITIPNTVRALNVAYQFAWTYISKFLSGIDQNGSSVELNTFDNNTLSNEVSNLQPETYDKSISIEDEQTNLVESSLGRSNSFGGPRQLGNAFSGSPQLPNGNLPNDRLSISSIFNFDNALADQLALAPNNVKVGAFETAPTFTKCTQSYVLEVLWRTVESFIIAEDLKLG